MPDVTETLAPKSEQLDAIDLRGRDPQIFTVTRVDVRPGTDQPVSVHLAEFPRPWKPSKNMRRVLAHCWGRESDSWPDERVELFCDERVKFGNDTPGGVRIKRISGIDKPQKVPVLVTQGRAGYYDVSPLPTAPTDAPAPSPVATLLAQIKTAADNAGVDVATIAQEWAESHGGQAIRDTSDVGGLKLLLDDLRARAGE